MNVNKTLVIKLENKDAQQFKEILKCVDKSQLKGSPAKNHEECMKLYSQAKCKKYGTV